MSDISTKYGWTIPTEYDYDYYDEFVSLINEIDAQCYQNDPVSTAVDHGGLGGLTDDDHTQYFKVTGRLAESLTVSSASVLAPDGEFSGNITVAGSVTSALALTSTLNVASTITGAGALVVAGTVTGVTDLTASGSLVAADGEFSSDVTVAGSVRGALKGTSTADFASTITGAGSVVGDNISATDKIYAGGDFITATSATADNLVAVDKIYAGGIVTTGAALVVAGTVTGVTSLTASGSVVAVDGEFSDDVTVGDDLSVTGDITTATNITATASVVGDNISATDKIYAGGIVTTGSNLVIAGTVTGITNLTASGSVKAADGEFSDDVTIGDDLTVTGDMTLTGSVGALKGSGAATFAGTITGAGSMIGDNVSATDKIYAGGVVTTADALVIAGTLTGVTNLTASGSVKAADGEFSDDVTVGDDLAVVGNVTSSGGLVSGASVKATQLHTTPVSAATPIADEVLTYDSSISAWTPKDVSGGIDHGAIGGLSDDDHTQYFKVTGRSGESLTVTSASVIVPDVEISSDLTLAGSVISALKGSSTAEFAGTITGGGSVIAVDGEFSNDVTIGNDLSIVGDITTVTNITATGSLTVTGDVDATRLQTSPVSAATPGANQVLTYDSGISAWTPKAPAGGTAVEDADADTKVQTEESADEDIIRFDTAGVEHLRLESDGTATKSGSCDICLIKTGTYTGDGSTAQNITGVGFQPKFVEVWVRPEDAVGATCGTWRRSDQSSDQAAILHGGVATGHVGIDDKLISIDADGFTVDDAGSNGNPNKLNSLYHYLCLG